MRLQPYENAWCCVKCQCLNVRKKEKRKKEKKEKTQRVSNSRSPLLEAHAWSVGLLVRGQGGFLYTFIVH